MHALLFLSSVLLVVLGGYFLLGVLRRQGDWSRRRDLQLLILAAPVVSLGLGLGGLHHFANRACFLGAPGWDYTLGVLLPFGNGLMALGGLGLGLVRLVLLHRVVARSGVPSHPELQALVDGLAARLGARRPRLLVCVYDRPLALTCGLFRPSLLLSTWTLDHLDPRELECVIAHELGHVARGDYLVVWLATILRDAFCYLPTSRAAYRQVQEEKELASDEIAVGATNRPLDLASALAKVWHYAVGGSVWGTAQALVGAGTSIEVRIERLLAASGASERVSRRSALGTPRSRVVALGVGATTLAGLLLLEAANVAVMLAPMGCGPASALGRLF